MSSSIEKLKRFRLKYACVDLYFGPEALGELEEELSCFERVMIATGRRSAKVSSALEEVTRMLLKHGVKYEVVSEVTPNPWASQADKLAQRAWSMDRYSVLTDNETREKRGMISVYPRASVDDPRYTLTLP